MPGQLRRRGDAGLPHPHSPQVLPQGVRNYPGFSSSLGPWLLALGCPRPDDLLRASLSWEKSSGVLLWKKETGSEIKVFPEFISRYYFVGYNEGGTHKRKGKKNRVCAILSQDELRGGDLNALTNCCTSAFLSLAALILLSFHSKALLFLSPVGKGTPDP